MTVRISLGRTRSIRMQDFESIRYDFLRKFSDTYEFLYDNYDNVAGFAEAMEFGDWFIENFPDEKLTELAKAIKTMVEEQSDVEDWLNRTDLRATLKMNVIVLLARAGYPPKIRDEVYKEILEQAENFKRHSSPRPYSTFSEDSISIAAEP